MNSAAAKTARTHTIGGYIAGAISSSTGMKLVMAITGLGLFLFLVSHVVSNLQVFLGYEGVNAYGAFLKGKPELLWTARLGLLAAVVLHIWAAVRLSRINHAARPQQYVKKSWRTASWYSRYMLVSGGIVFAFIVFHILHFTAGVILPEYFVFRDPAERHDVARMMILGFSKPWVVLVYVVSMIFIGLHLAHGIWSSLQSLGLWGARWTPFWLKAGKVIAWVIALAFIAIPLGILAGAVEHHWEGGTEQLRIERPN